MAQRVTAQVVAGLDGLRGGRSHCTKTATSSPPARYARDIDVANLDGDGRRPGRRVADGDKGRRDRQTWSPTPSRTRGRTGPRSSLGRRGPRPRASLTPFITPG